MPRSKPNPTAHSDEHSTLDCESPSSHDSLEDLSPLPHGALHEDSPHSVLLHTHPCLTEQVLLHPSLSALLPSSHAAFDATRVRR